VSPEEKNNLVLATLLDLCHNDVAVEHVKHWRSKRSPQIDATRLLLLIWREEQARLKVPLAEDGLLAGSMETS
jgi:hypothetical protein